MGEIKNGGIILYPDEKKKRKMEKQLRGQSKLQKWLRAAEWIWIAAFTGIFVILVREAGLLLCFSLVLFMDIVWTGIWTGLRSAVWRSEEEAFRGRKDEKLLIRGKYLFYSYRNRRLIPDRGEAVVCLLLENAFPKQNGRIVFCGPVRRRYYSYDPGAESDYIDTSAVLPEETGRDNGESVFVLYDYFTPCLADHLHS